MTDQSDTTKRLDEIEVSKPWLARCNLIPPHARCSATEESFRELLSIALELNAKVDRLEVDLVAACTRYDRTLAERLQLDALKTELTKAHTENERMENAWRREIEIERREHLGDHEVIAALTGLTGAHMWKPDQAREWREHHAPRAEELEQLRARVKELEANLNRAGDCYDAMSGKADGLQDRIHELHGALTTLASAARPHAWGPGREHMRRAVERADALTADSEVTL